MAIFTRLIARRVIGSAPVVRCMHFTISEIATQAKKSLPVKKSCFWISLWVKRTDMERKVPRFVSITQGLTACRIGPASIARGGFLLLSAAGYSVRRFASSGIIGKIVISAFIAGISVATGITCIHIRPRLWPIELSPTRKRFLPAPSAIQSWATELHYGLKLGLST